MMDRLKKILELNRRNPDDPFTLYAIGLEYLSMDDFAKAEEYFSILLNKHPDYLATYYQYGKLLENKGVIDQARDIFNKGLVIATNQNDLHTKAELQDALDNLY